MTTPGPGTRCSPRPIPRGHPGISQTPTTKSAPGSTSSPTCSARSRTSRSPTGTSSCPNDSLPAASIGSQLPRAESHNGSAEDLVVGRLLNSDLTAALRALPDRHRMVVYLSDLQGLGYQQISALTGIPLGSVKSCLHRARNRLRADLGAYASQG